MSNGIIIVLNPRPLETDFERGSSRREEIQNSKIFPNFFTLKSLMMMKQVRWGIFFEFLISFLHIIYIYIININISKKREILN